MKPFKVSVCFWPDQLKNFSLKGQAAVVLDVLRASTTIVNALSSGASWVQAVTGVGQAHKLSRSYPRGAVLLGGERGGVRIPGFHLGNSPLEFSPQKVRGKGIIFTTTNGTRALEQCRAASIILVAGLTNAASAARYIVKLNRDTVLVCACQERDFSLEDGIGAGALAYKLEQRGAQLSLEAKLAKTMFLHFRQGLAQALRKTSHGQNLAKLGLGRDILACAKLDSKESVPVLQGKRLIDRPSFV